MLLKPKLLLQRIRRCVDLIVQALESLFDKVRFSGPKGLRAANPALVQTISRSRRIYTEVDQREMARFLFDNLAYIEAAQEQRDHFLGRELTSIVRDGKIFSGRDLILPEAREILLLWAFDKRRCLDGMAAPDLDQANERILHSFIDRNLPDGEKHEILANAWERVRTRRRD